MANLDSILKENDVKTFNVLQLYNDYRQSNTKLLYHLDDMHWNPNGVQLVSKEIAKTIIADYPSLINGELLPYCFKKFVSHVIKRLCKYQFVIK